MVIGDTPQLEEEGTVKQEDVGGDDEQKESYQTRGGEPGGGSQ